MLISGLAAEIKPLRNGDFYYATDTGDLYLGTEGGNICIRQGNRKEWVAYVTVDNESVTVQNVGINTLGEEPALTTSGAGILSIDTVKTRFISSPGLKFQITVMPVTADRVATVNNSTENSLVITTIDTEGTESDCSMFIHLTVWE